MNRGDKIYLVVILLVLIALIPFVWLMPSWGQTETWYIWSAELYLINLTAADSVNSAIIAQFGKWHEMKEINTNWEFKIGGQWVEQEGTQDTLTLPMKYIWAVTDSTVDIFRRDTNPYSMKWYYQVSGQTIIDEDYELHAVNLISGSLTIEDTVFTAQDNRLKGLRVSNKVVEHRHMVLEKKAKKLKKVLALMGAELWARSLDGKQYNVFGNRIQDEWLQLVWPGNEKQWRPMGWKVLKLKSKKRIEISRVEP